MHGHFPCLSRDVWLAGVLDAHGKDVTTVAVISPYKAQVSLLRRRFETARIDMSRVDFATVDGYQVTTILCSPGEGTKWKHV